MSETDERVEPEILGIDDVEEIEDVANDNQPEIVAIEEPEEVPDDNQPELISVDEPDEAPEIEGVDDIEEVEEVEEPKPLRPPTSRRPSTQKRPRTTARGRRDRKTDRPGTQRTGTRRYGRSGDDKAKLIVIAVTAGLLLILVVAAIAKATRKPPAPPEKRTIFIKHQLDRARALKREGQDLIREAYKASSPQGKNNYLRQAMDKLRQSQVAYTGLIEQYQGPQYEYLHRESQEVMKSLYLCQKSITISAQ